MPTISMFYGIIIRMFWDEHAPPHLHAKYGDHKATVSILDLCILEGHLPRRATQLVLDWTELNQAELLQNWERCKAKKHPFPIKPLA